MCSGCEAKEDYEPSDWFHHVFFLYRLQKGGYPFAADDLDLEEWLDIAELKEAIQAFKYGQQ